MGQPPHCSDRCAGVTCPDTKVVQVNPCVTEIYHYECRVCFIFDTTEDCSDDPSTPSLFPCFWWTCTKFLTETEVIKNGTCKDCDPMPFPEQHVPHEGSAPRFRLPSELQPHFRNRQFKKNHPGCKCCKRVLVWDLGYYGTDLRVAGLDQYVDTYRFQSLERVARWYEELGIPVDFVTGGSSQGLGFYTGFEDFDPDTVAVDEGYWTGNIDDYLLIIWPFPTADTDLDGDQLCAPGDGELPDKWLSTPCDQPDHQHLGGLPSWWEKVSAGEWSGRVLIITTANNKDITGNEARIGNAVAIFLNTLTDVHGFDIDPDIRTIETEDELEIMDADLMEGVTSLQGQTQFVDTALAVIEGGEDLALANGSFRSGTEWCVNGEGETFEGTWTVMARNRVEKANDHIVDFVIAGNRSLLLASAASNASQQRFFENLINVPLREPNTI